VLRNALLPQITDLALSLGVIFGGALVTEYVFSYPGMGQVLYTAILQGDFNLMMGITVFSVIGIATAALLVDLTYPLFDPRIRYQ
jgi:peptide/nickel transport system permease protein